MLITVFLVLKHVNMHDTHQINFGVSESTAYRVTVWVEDILIKSGEFALPSKKVLVTETSAVEAILIDVTEQEIDRPKKRQKEYYSGKKTTHSEFDAKTMEIICVINDKGSVHDFTMYKNSVGYKIIASIEIKADSGYQGILRFHENSMTPIKKKQKINP